MSEAKYSYCESCFATPFSPWCIRPLIAGMKVGGGIDSDSLCGRVKMQEGGWDLGVEVDQSRTRSICSKCLDIYRRENEKDSK